MTPIRSATVSLALAAALSLLPPASATTAPAPPPAQDATVQQAGHGRLATANAGAPRPGLPWSLWDEPAGMGVPPAWDLATGAGQVIAVVDTGITPPDLDADVLPGYDFVSSPGNGLNGDGRDPDPADPRDHSDAVLCPDGPLPPHSTWHGTHMAGVAAADAGAAASGVAPDAKILPVRVVDPVSAVVRAPGGEPFSTRGGIGRLHRTIAGSIGEPRSRELCTRGGTPCFQEFAHGWIFWGAGRGARWSEGLPVPWWEISSAG